MNYFEIKELKKAYDNGKNISKLLRDKLKSNENSSDIIVWKLYKYLREKL